jgi:hypothetical protein
MEDFEASKIDLERQYENEIANTTFTFEDENSLKRRALFWNETEKNQHMIWDNQLADVERWLMDHKYEIEKNFTSLDWLKLYADSILDLNINMNAVLRLETADRKEAFKGNEGLDQENWESLAREARQLAQLYEEIKKYEADLEVDVQSFMTS